LDSNPVKRLLIYLKSIPRKAWWLIVLAAIYGAVGTYWLICDWRAGTLGKDGMLSYLMFWQMLWVLISALPLYNRRVGDWVFRRNGK
jgi:hypothetical protein